MGNDKGNRKEGRRTDYYDYNLLAVVILLVAFGLIILYSTSSYVAEMRFGDDMYFLKRQLLYAVISIAAMIFVSLFDYHILMKLAGLGYVLALILMGLVLSPLGVTRNGARRWLRLGIQFQPSEIAKIAVIIFIPLVIVSMGRRFKSIRAMMVPLILGLVQGLGAYLFTDNLSTAIIIMAITVVIVFIAHPNTALFLIGGAVGAAGVAGLVFYLVRTASSSATFRIQRILVWLSPEEYSDTGGYQIMQALYALGSGGLFGKGLGNSTQKLGPLPEAQNDMIFSIVCEELGVFGGVLLLVMFGFLLYRLFVIAQNAPDLYGSLMVTGIFGHIALQVILNICVVINLIPTTGVTLPFVSYGGTSLLFLMMEMAIALSVSRRIRFKTETKELWGSRS